MAGTSQPDEGSSLIHGGGEIDVVGVSKHFGGAPALVEVSVSFVPGTVHALVGENGAGKSTLGKLLSGVHLPDEGEIRIAGVPVTLRSPREALQHGIVTIAQELSIVPGLSVAENVFLGAAPSRRGFVRSRELRRRYVELSERLGFAVAPDVMAGGLRTADQQKVEIMRALARNASVVIMDEPTAALAQHEAAALHSVIRSLADGGKTVILISHFLSEVLDLSDRVTVLRDGRHVRTVAASEVVEADLIESMLGRPLGAAYPEKRFASPEAPVLLRVGELSAPQVRSVSLEVHSGEILGIAGLVGAGRSEFARAAFGDVKPFEGVVEIAGAPLEDAHPRSAIRQGMVLIPESRKELGLLVERPVRENISLAQLRKVSRMGWIARDAERAVVNELMDRVKVKAADINLPVAALSGGNQQKLLFARAILCGPQVLIADEPTRGVDVGSKRAIYDLLVELAASGMAIVVISSELEEILGLAHRVIVMRGGSVVRELRGEEMTEHAVLEAAFSGIEMKKEGTAE
jgi:simple sugar transport system ATP-binding protein/ribose transport system ATP-binding protein